MVKRKDPLPITRQCALLGLSRSAVYYRPRPVPEGDLQLMRLMHKTFEREHNKIHFKGAGR